MEHYLGEKLKKLRESRGWTQADLAKRLNKAVSTVSGYESDAHAIPLDVLSSISSLFSISTDELLGLDAPELLSLSGLTEDQKKTLVKLRDEFLAPSQQGNDLSPQQMEILHDVIKSLWLIAGLRYGASTRQSSVLICPPMLEVQCWGTYRYI